MWESRMEDGDVEEGVYELRAKSRWIEGGADHKRQLDDDDHPRPTSNKNPTTYNNHKSN
jgi:hypothetical protein